MVSKCCGPCECGRLAIVIYAQLVTHPIAETTRECVTDLQSTVNNVYISVLPSRIYIGTHQFTPTDRVHITSKGIRIIAPNVKRLEEKVILDIQMREVVKIVSCFKSPQTIIFVYVLNACGVYVRESLEMMKTIHDNCK